MSVNPSTAVAGGAPLTLSVDWTATTGTSGCSMNANSCPTFAGSCSAGYWLVGLFCSTLAASDLASAQGDCDLNNIVVLTDDSSGPDNGGTGTSYNTCSTVSTLGDIFGGLPGTLNCITDGGSSGGWTDHWPTGQTSGGATGVFEETGSGTPFNPANSGVDCPPSASNIAAGAIPDTCAFVVIPISFEYFCVVDICLPDTSAPNDGITEQTSDYLATIFQYPWAPSFTSSSSVTALAGSALHFAVTTSASPTASVSEVGGLPSGVSFVRQSGGSALLTGTPSLTSPGVYDVSFAATNGISPSAVQHFTLTVAGPPPGLISISPTSGLPAGGSSVTMVGKNLCGLTAVHFGTSAGIDPTINPGCTEVHVTVPAWAGGDATRPHSVSVSIQTLGGSASAPEDYTYISPGYWMVASDGGVFSFGGASFFGSMGGKRLNEPIVAMADTPDHQGYWLFAADGGVFSFGDARFYGSVPQALGPHRKLNAPVVAAEATPDGRGYRMFAADGGVFDFGDAAFVGSLPGLHVKPHRPIVAAAADPVGQGYWLVGSDGGLYALGDAPFEGSLGGRSIPAPVVSMVSTVTGNGYWMFGANGEAWSFGDAVNHGWPSLVSSPIAAGAATTTDGGYWIIGRNGAVFAFGDAAHLGSLPGLGVRVDDIVGGIGF